MTKIYVCPDCGHEDRNMGMTERQEVELDLNTLQPGRFLSGEVLGYFCLNCGNEADDPSLDEVQKEGGEKDA